MASRRFFGSSDFYEKALKGQLSPADFSFAASGTSEMKLLILPQLVRIYCSAKMVGDYSFTKSLLYTEKLAGNISASLGFIRENNYYIPNTALKEDLRNMTTRPQRVLAILKKTIKNPTYNDICYTARGINLQNMAIPAEIADRISVL